MDPNTPQLDDEISILTRPIVPPWGTSKAGPKTEGFFCPWDHPDAQPPPLPPHYANWRPMSPRRGARLYGLASEADIINPRPLHFNRSSSRSPPMHRRVIFRPELQHRSRSESRRPKEEKVQTQYKSSVKIKTLPIAETLAPTSDERKKESEPIREPEKKNHPPSVYNGQYANGQSNPVKVSCDNGQSTETIVTREKSEMSVKTDKNTDVQACSQNKTDVSSEGESKIEATQIQPPWRKAGSSSLKSNVTVMSLMQPARRSRKALTSTSAESAAVTSAAMVSLHSQAVQTQQTSRQHFQQRTYQQQVTQQQQVEQHEVQQLQVQQHEVQQQQVQQQQLQQQQQQVQFQQQQSQETQTQHEDQHVEQQHSTQQETPPRLATSSYPKIQKQPSSEDAPWRSPRLKRREINKLLPSSREIAPDQPSWRQPRRQPVRTESQVTSVTLSNTTTPAPVAPSSVITSAKAGNEEHVISMISSSAEAKTVEVETKSEDAKLSATSQCFAVQSTAEKNISNEPASSMVQPILSQSSPIMYTGSTSSIVHSTPHPLPLSTGTCYTSTSVISLETSPKISPKVTSTPTISSSKEDRRKKEQETVMKQVAPVSDVETETKQETIHEADIKTTISQETATNRIVTSDVAIETKTQGKLSIKTNVQHTPDNENLNKHIAINKNTEYSTDETKKEIKSSDTPDRDDSAATIAPEPKSPELNLQKSVEIDPHPPSPPPLPILPLQPQQVACGIATESDHPSLLNELTKVSSVFLQKGIAADEITEVAPTEEDYPPEPVKGRIQKFEKQGSFDIDKPSKDKQAAAVKPVGPWVKKTSAGVVRPEDWDTKGSWVEASGALPFVTPERQAIGDPSISAASMALSHSNKDQKTATVESPEESKQPEPPRTHLPDRPQLQKQLQQQNPDQHSSIQPLQLQRLRCRSRTLSSGEYSHSYCDVEKKTMPPMGPLAAGVQPASSGGTETPSILEKDGDPLFDSWCDPNNPRIIQFQDVSAAAFKIKSGIMNTPCTRSNMSNLVDCDIYFKKEFNQYTGSFKERGARYTLLCLNQDQKRKGVIAASAGNHALALSYHGLTLGIPVTVVMPIVAPIMKVQACRQYGANVMVTGQDIFECRGIALKMAQERDLLYINGYDHPHILAGQGTIGLEIVEQVADIDAVVVPVGGGGLIAGLALAVKSLYPQIKVIGVESEQCPSFQAALDAGKPVYLKAESSLADGLAVPQVGVNAFATARTLVDKVVSVREEWIAIAILRLVEMEKAVVEGAGATALAALLAGKLPELKGKRVVIPLCGGNIDTTILGRCLERGLAADGRLVKFTVTVSDRPGGIAELTRLLANLGVSIKDMMHERAWIKSDIFSVEVKVVAETRDYEHLLELKTALVNRYEQVTFPLPVKVT